MSWLSAVLKYHGPQSNTGSLITYPTNRLLLDDVEMSASLMDKFCHAEPLEAVDHLAVQVGQGKVRAAACKMWRHVPHPTDLVWLGWVGAVCCWAHVCTFIVGQ